MEIAYRAKNLPSTLALLNVAFTMAHQFLPRDTAKRGLAIACSLSVCDVGGS